MKLKPDRLQELMEKAKGASTNASPHLSHFYVGCVILGKTGETYTGANIEFDNYSNTIHAEEGALSEMFQYGDSPAAIIVYTRPKTGGNEVCFPCGMCRQSLYERCKNEKVPVIACTCNRGVWTHETYTIGELLPKGFKL